MNLLHTIFSCGLIHKCSGHCVVNVLILGEGRKLKILHHVHWKTFFFLEFPSQPASGDCDVVMVVKFQLYRITGLVMVRGRLCLVSCITPRLIFTLLSRQFTWRAHHTPPCTDTGASESRCRKKAKLCVHHKAAENWLSCASSCRNALTPGEKQKRGWTWTCCRNKSFAACSSC